MHQDNDVQISAVTHGGRFYAANKAESHGAEEADIKTLGNWKVGDAYEEVYKRKLPVKAMLASAMFNAENLPSYVLPRGHLGTFYHYARQILLIVIDAHRTPARSSSSAISLGRKRAHRVP